MKTSQLKSLTDKNLMAHLAKGETVALGELYLRYGAMVRSAVARFAPRLSAAEREDICHDVFVVLCETARRYKEQMRFRAWLYGIAVRKSLNAGHSSGLRHRLLARHFESSDAHSFAPTPATIVENKNEIEIALSHISSTQRQVLLLHVEGFTGEEIAQMLAIKPKTVWTRLHRARRTLLERNRQQQARTVLVQE